MFLKYSGALAKLTLAIAAILAALFAIRPTITIELDATRHQDGHAYVATVPFWAVFFAAPDNIKSLFKDSTLFNNGAALGPAKSAHADIRSMGGGRWSYWDNYILLSQPNSDTTNLQSKLKPPIYTLDVKFDPPLSLLLTAGALFIFLAAHFLWHQIFSIHRSLPHLEKIVNCHFWPKIQLGYSPEIDGLRALAVTLVTLYHFDVDLLKGGFVGVDVFFVISGYLITRIVSSELSAGRFSFKEFYFRRAKRIFPALIVIHALTFCVALLIFGSKHLKNFSESLISSSLFISNLYFYSQSGYFDFDAITKPLLHTWSLGVEEHFYLVFPLMLLIARTFFTFNGAAFAVIVFGAISLFAGQWFLSFDRSGAFFISPFRFFEFSIGALLVFIRRPILSTNISQLLALLGFGLILIPAVFYSHDTPFPGIAALPVCLGSALLLFFRDSSVVHGTLGRRWIVRVGLISYSAYLIHWPLVVFYKATRVSLLPLQFLEIVLLIIGTLVISEAMFRLVEKPWRHVAHGEIHWGLKVSLKNLLLALSLPIFLGIVTYGTGGWPQRFPDEMNKHAKVPLEEHHRYVWDRFNNRLLKAFQDDGRKKVLLIGDSQAGDFLNILSEEIGDNVLDVSTFLLPAYCQAVVPASQDYYTALNIETELREECRTRQEDLLHDSRISAADFIVFSSSWRDYGIGQIGNTINFLKQRNRQATLIVVGTKIQSRGGLEVVYLSRWSALSPEELSFAARLPSLDATRVALEKVIGDARLLDPGRSICNWESKRCSVFSDDGMIMFSDVSHVTRSGAKTIGRRLSLAGELDVFK